VRKRNGRLVPRTACNATSGRFVERVAFDRRAGSVGVAFGAAERLGVAVAARERAVVETVGRAEDDSGTAEARNVVGTTVVGGAGVRTGRAERRTDVLRGGATVSGRYAGRGVGSGAAPCRGRTSDRFSAAAMPSAIVAHPPTSRKAVSSPRKRLQLM
jgi:hypothetical protein